MLGGSGPSCISSESGPSSGLIAAHHPPCPVPPGFGPQGLLAPFWALGSGWETLSLGSCLLGWHPQAWPWPSRLVALTDHLSAVHLPFPPPPGRCQVSSFLIRQITTPHNLTASFLGRSWGSGPPLEPGGQHMGPPGTRILRVFANPSFVPADWAASQQVRRQGLLVPLVKLHASVNSLDSCLFVGHL